MTAADVLVETLIDWDVDTIFGLPGDGINGLMESLRTHQELSGLCQPLGNAIDYVDLRGALEQRTIRREQPYGARSEHRDTLPRTDTGQFRGMESRREDIGQE